jgi:hypothetical protein
MAERHRSFAPLGALLLAACLAATPATADVSVFLATVGFDEDANLESAPGFGLRWGKSSGFFGGETSLMLSRPDREVSTTSLNRSESATVIFYEGRFLVNIPAGEFKPFVSVGYGAITVLPGDLDKDVANVDAGDRQTLRALSETETNQVFSYGAGCRYALNERIDARLDLRQYRVFSVTGAVVEQVAGEAAAELVADEGTVQYNELSVGIVFRF